MARLKYCRRSAVLFACCLDNYPRWCFGLGGTPRTHFLEHYISRIDHFAVGILTLEVFFALWKFPPAVSEWPHLEQHWLTEARRAWRSYWMDAVGLFQLFHSRGAKALRATLRGTPAIPQFAEKLQVLCSALRAAADSSPNSSMSPLLHVAAGLLDWRNTLSWEEVWSLLRDGSRTCGQMASAACDSTRSTVDASIGPSGSTWVGEKSISELNETDSQHSELLLSSSRLHVAMPLSQDTMDRPLTREPAMAGDMPRQEDVGRLESNLLPKLGSLEAPLPEAAQDEQPLSSRQSFRVGSGSQQVLPTTAPVASAKVTLTGLATRGAPPPNSSHPVGSCPGSCLRSCQEPRRASLMGPPGIARKETTATRVSLRTVTAAQPARARTSPTLTGPSESPVQTACLGSPAGVLFRQAGSALDRRGTSAAQEGVLLRRSPQTCTAVAPWVLSKRG